MGPRARVVMPGASCGAKDRMGLYSRLFARYYDFLMAGYEGHIAACKRELLSSLSGTIVEIGPGTGANLQYLKPGTRRIGIEPNRHMHRAISQPALTAGSPPPRDRAC